MTSDKSRTSGCSSSDNNAPTQYFTNGLVTYDHFLCWVIIRFFFSGSTTIRLHKFLFQQWFFYFTNSINANSNELNKDKNDEENCEWRARRVASCCCKYLTRWIGVSVSSFYLLFRKYDREVLETPLIWRRRKSFLNRTLRPLSRLEGIWQFSRSTALIFLKN